MKNHQALLGRAALATVVGVLVEVSVMLTLVRIDNKIIMVIEENH